MKTNRQADSPARVIAGCVIFVVVGLWLVNTDTLPSQVIGILSIVFFGFGGIAYLYRNVLKLAIRARSEPEYHLKDSPSSVQVTRMDVDDDDEVIGYWRRSCPNLVEQFQSVSVVETVNSAGYRSLMVDAGEFYRAEPELTQLHDEIVSGLSQLPDVTEVVREDTEVWLVKGDIASDKLVQQAAIAVDRFHRKRLDSGVRKTSNSDG